MAVGRQRCMLGKKHCTLNIVGVMDGEPSWPEGGWEALLAHDMHKTSQSKGGDPWEKTEHCKDVGWCGSPRLMGGLTSIIPLGAK